jgi:hypothetical protein
MKASPWRQTTQDVLSQRTLPDLFHKCLDDRQGYISLQKGCANLA